MLRLLNNKRSPSTYLNEVEAEKDAKILYDVEYQIIYLKCFISFIR